jgi:hypothetical protein
MFLKVHHSEHLRGLCLVSFSVAYESLMRRLLNLARAESWGEFVSQVREGGQSDVLVLPSYEVPLALRQIEVAAEALRHYPKESHGRRVFTNRTFFDLPGYSWHPLSFYWEDGVPLWLRTVLGAVVFMGSETFHPVLRHTLFRQAYRDLLAYDPQPQPGLLHDFLA